MYAEKIMTLEQCRLNFILLAHQKVIMIEIIFHNNIIITFYQELICILLNNLAEKCSITFLTRYSFHDKVVNVLSCYKSYIIRNYFIL